MPPVHSQPQRTIVYVDGFNLYFGVLKARPNLKWFDIPSFMDNIRRGDIVTKVKYFTAIVDPDEETLRQARQKLYIQALNRNDRVEVIYGKYQEREVCCKAHCRQNYFIPEEKKTDVSIAVHMVSDAIDGQMERIVLVSGDSDLEPALKWIRKRFVHIPISVYVPEFEPDGRMRRNDSYRHLGIDTTILPTKNILAFQLPESIALGSGRSLRRPTEWR